MHISFVNSIVSPKLRLVNKALPNRRLVWHQLISDGLHLTKIKALPDLLIQIVNPVVNVDEKIAIIRVVCTKSDDIHHIGDGASSQSLI